LSRLFYERLGEQIANELVEWFNQVDSTYRSDLREINESNFARFDAKLEQRFAEQDARIARRFAEAAVKRVLGACSHRYPPRWAGARPDEHRGWTRVERRGFRAPTTHHRSHPR
jgi:hypothetical protein